MAPKMLAVLATGGLRRVHPVRARECDAIGAHGRDTTAVVPPTQYGPQAMAAKVSGCMADRRGSCDVSRVR